MFYTAKDTDIKTSLIVENDYDYKIGKKYIGSFQNKKGFAIEKFLLRYAFSLNENAPYLPASVLWRPKEAFSDGVSLKTRSWHTILSEYFNKVLTDDEYVKNMVNFKSIYKDKLAHQQNKLVLIKKYKKQLIDVINSPRSNNSPQSGNSLSNSSSSNSSSTSQITSSLSSSSTSTATISTQISVTTQTEILSTSGNKSVNQQTTAIEKSDSKKSSSSSSKSLESLPIYKLDYMIYLLDKKTSGGNGGGSRSSKNSNKKSKNLQKFHDNYYQQLSIFIKNNIDLFDEKVEQEKLYKLTISPPIPHTKEACYYRSIYENILGYPMLYGESEDVTTHLNAFFDHMQGLCFYFYLYKSVIIFIIFIIIIVGNCDGLIEYYWMPKFVECNGDPSARVLSNYK